MSVELNNISDATSRYCVGCGACLAVCPENALRYQLNEEGFFEAFVVADQCVHCGLCRKVCYKFFSENESGTELEQGELFAARSQQMDVVQSCTSGGIAYEIARSCLEKGYKVAGVVYDDITHRAKTILTDSMEVLEQMKGSKYLQADMQEVLKQLTEEVALYPDQKYVFFGTPCQISGLKKLLHVRKIKNEVLTIDLFCHGVPSYRVWDEYRRPYSSLCSVVFRSKRRGWHNFTMEFESGAVKYLQVAERDLFYQVFFDNILLNKPCFDCKLRSRYSQADIRLGDFWGEKYQERQDGVSACLIFSNEGKKIYSQLVADGCIQQLAKESVSDCMTYQSHSDYTNWSVREYAFEWLQNGMPLRKVVQRYRKMLPYTYRFKLMLKRWISFVPVGVINRLKIWYRRRG